MDALSDKIMVMTAFLTLFALGLFRDWTMFALLCAIASMSREFFVSGIRMLASNQGIVLAAEKMGKYKAALQMYSLGAIIFTKASADLALAGTAFDAIVFYSAIATLAISTVLSIWSGATYATRYGYLLKQ